MKILFLSYFFEPDLSACSFRNTSLFIELSKQLNQSDSLELITTFPNRYDSYRSEKSVLSFKDKKNIKINKINVPKHSSGIIGQIKSFNIFYKKTLHIVKNEEYDLVYASSSKLFTAFLAARISYGKNAKLYLDIRDIFREVALDIYKNSIVRLGLNLFLKPVEYYTFKKANHINLVSEKFRSYFKYKTNYTFFTNGIDPIFIEQESKKHTNNNNEILYAGNIGESQGLHIIIPELALKLKNYNFKLIGDGGCKTKLVQELKNKKIKNVSIFPPVNRTELIKEYQQTDYLFLHLNNHKAFERVLPSKLFEYACFKKPIIAGVGGYAAIFINENIPNTILFNPLQSNELLEKLKNHSYKEVERKKFIEKYNRNNINFEMAKSIIDYINN